MTTNRNRLGFLKGTYYVPPVYRCTNVWGTLANRFSMMTEGLKLLAALGTPDLVISTSDARQMGTAPSIVDYIFTDPPYADKVQYGELNFVWESWLGFDTHWHDEEIIVNEVRGTTLQDWANMMRQAMSECYRVLKPGRWLSLCYHHTSPEIWTRVQDLMAEVGFLVDRSDSVVFIETGQKTYNQTQADKVTKRDLVVNYRKPRPGEVSPLVQINGREDRRTFAEKVHTVIREYLGAHPGATKDRVYDRVVSCMVRAGLMEAHNFDELLRLVAEEVKTPVMKNLFERKEPDVFGAHQVSRWYLKQRELAVADAAETAKEDAAASVIGAFIAKLLRENPEEMGVHYSEIFERYVYTVKDKPRRELAEWLLDYLYKTGYGTYRLPISQEEQRLKAQGRDKGTMRYIKRYLAYLERGIAVPEKERPNDATLAEWIHHCRRSGLYEQGKLLYEIGGINLGRLPEKMRFDIQEDYEVCVRELARNQLAQSGKERGAKRQRVGTKPGE